MERIASAAHCSPSQVWLTWAEADCDESTWATAVTVTTDGSGSLQIDLYKPVAEMVPKVELPPAIPFTFQVTAVLAFSTVAVNCCVPPAAATDALVGESETIPAVTVTVAVPDLVGSTLETARTVTDAGAGTAAGAV